MGPVAIKMNIVSLDYHRQLKVRFWHFSHFYILSIHALHHLSSSVQHVFFCCCVCVCRCQRSPVIINLAFAHSRSFASTPIVVRLALLSGLLSAQCSAMLCLLCSVVWRSVQWKSILGTLDLLLLTPPWVSAQTTMNIHVPESTPSTWHAIFCFTVFATVTSGIWMSRTKLKLDVPLSAIGSRLDSIETIWSGTMLVWGQS